MCIYIKGARVKEIKINTPQSEEEFKKRFSFKNGEIIVNRVKIKSISKDEVKINTPQTMEEFKERISF